MMLNFPIKSLLQKEFDTMEVLHQFRHQNKTIQIYENKEWFITTTDSVLLSDFIEIHLKDKKILDIGSGVGTIPLLLSLRTKAKIYGIEIQEDVYQLSLKSVKLNQLEDQIHLFRGDIRKDSFFEPECFDLVVSNPPYFPYHTEKVTNVEKHKKYARHEVTLTFEELVKQVKKLLKEHGRFVFIHRTDRLIDVLEILEKYGFEPKRLQFIYDNPCKKSELFLLEATKYGKRELKILPPLFIKERKEE